MRTRLMQRAVCSLAVVGMLLPQASFAADTAPAQIADVALRDGGVLVGQVVDAQGKPLAEAPVSLRYAGREVAETTTDGQGVFAAQGLRGGQYEVVTGGGVAAYRLWAPETAPPSAARGALVVTGGEVVNGQWATPQCPPCGQPQPQPGVMSWIRRHPWATAAGVAAAIAIPIAVSGNDDSAS